MKLFERSNESELASNNIENEARRCVILAVKVPTVVDFAETIRLNAVKFLQGVNKNEIITIRKTRKYLIS